MGDDISSSLYTVRIISKALIIASTVAELGAGRKEF